MRQLLLANLLLVLLVLRPAHGVLFKDLDKLFPKLPKLPTLPKLLKIDSVEDVEESGEGLFKVPKLFKGSDKWLKDAFFDSKEKLNILKPKPLKNLFDLWADKSAEKEAFIDAKKDLAADKEAYYADKKDLFVEKKDELDDKIKAIFTDKKLIKDLFTELEDKVDEKDAYIKEKIDSAEDCEDEQEKTVEVVRYGKKKKIVVVDPESEEDPCFQDYERSRYGMSSGRHENDRERYFT